MYFNEEQVKNRIIIPFLSQLGFSANEMIFEKKLEIMIPRKGSILIENQIKKNVFSDIIVQRNTGNSLENIFLVEVKNSKHKINATDIEQGICYARLLKQMPPFVVITNGLETKVFDTISQNEISDIAQSQYFLQGNKLTIDEDLKREALKKFIDLNSSNMLQYCKLQVKSNLYEICGEEKTNKSIIDSVHFTRKKYINDFKNFILSGKSIYAYVGKSGIGKTNLLYSVIKEFEHSNPILFYNSGLLNNSLQESITQDFSFLNQREYKFHDLIDRINSICEKMNKKIFIIVDALDENNQPEKLKNEVNDLAKKIHNSNICFVLSCKTNDDEVDVWYNFTHNKGSKNFLGETVYYSNQFHFAGKLGTYVDKLDEKETKLIWEKYKNQYKIKGFLKGRVKELAQNPFLMRIIAETYEREVIESGLDEILLYDKWFERKYKQAKDSDLIKVILKKATSEIIASSNKEKVLFDTVLTNLLTIPNINQILKEAINLGIMNLTIDGKGEKYISFYNESILFYFYSVVTEKWSEKPLEELVGIFNTLTDDNFLWRTINFFISNIQKRYEAKNDIWSNRVAQQNNDICKLCTSIITINDEVSLICELSVEEMKMNIRYGLFSLAHRDCMPQNFPLKIIDGKKLRLTSSDILVIDNILKFFKYTPEAEMDRINQQLESALNMHKASLTQFYPTKTTAAEPFWALMEFNGNTNIGNIYPYPGSTKNNPVLFLDKEIASKYLAILRSIKIDINYVVVGLDRKYMLEVFKRVRVGELSFFLVVEYSERGAKAIEIGLEEVCQACVEYIHHHQ
ncbi:type I restriction enzyme HsdR N-terminal domain-containing protein [Paenibacillus sp. KN14-4R]|uniref:type I restriction enzyme HsdR N-terminal domain-containing protein n=1 Tax=Paenibacillus sp. KN14-4R TaxID=3445773 RepID=UPI003FA109C4